MKIRTRLIIGFLLITGVSFYYLTDWIVKELRPHYLKAMEESLVDTATLLAASLSKQNSSGTIETEDLEKTISLAQQKKLNAKIYDFLKTEMDLRVYITDLNGKVIFDSNNSRDSGEDYSRWINISRTLQGDYGARSTRTDENDPNSSVLHISSPIEQNGEMRGVLTVAKPTTNIIHFIEQAQKRLKTTVIIAIAGVILFATLLSLWVTEPMQRLTAYVRNVRKGKHSPRPRLHALGILGRTEVDELGDALIQMQETLEERKYAEQYVQNLTHEIKSPLCAIRGAVELIDDKMPPQDRTAFLRNIKSESERIQIIIDRMLELAKIENRTELQSIEKVSIARLLKKTTEPFRSQLAKNEIDLKMIVTEDLFISGEEFLLYQSLTNLLQNAIEFSPQKSSITIETANAKGRVIIRIKDGGSGIPDYALSRVFERFYSLQRPQTEKRSTGLGLSFVKEIIELHGGTVTLNNNEPPPGATATIELPSR
ncbi:MAG: two-component system sensor histidine kinase CreC [Chitinispirillaceae bacterium]